MREFSTPNPNLDGKTILVTGGTGSFGRNFVRVILERYAPAKLIVFSRDEMKQYDMANRISTDEYPCMRYFIGDVRDASRLEMAMRDVDYVIHAAALKHIPSAEYNPFECIRTNVHGAENVVNAAIKAGVKRVVALSTDKAASPVNLYGASKLAADKIFAAANNLSGHGATRFSIVRYGNVFGSRGSVVPLFQRLLDEGASHLPITDTRMTRFWITLDQGVDFVLSCLSMMQGGELFVPKIPSMRIVDLARAMAPSLKHRVIGIRPGEKLHEILITEDEARLTLALEDRYVIGPSFAGWNHESYEAIGAVAVPEAFSYASDTNEEWLDERAMPAMLMSGAKAA